jgi:disease resistance protein RPM1
MLPALRYLRLYNDNKVSGEDAVDMSVVTADAFPCTTECRFVCITAVPSIFPQGAARKLKYLKFAFPAMWIARNNFALGMRHLSSLETTRVYLSCEGATDVEVKEANAALRAAVDDHPNHPKLKIH